MPFLRQSTAQTVRFGPCLDKTDGVTEETALTLAQADMRLSKDGGAFAQKNASGNATHDSDGWYSTSLDATDTDTVGELILNVHQPANMLPVWLRWWVLEEAIYDDIFGAAAVGYATPAQVNTEVLDVLNTDTFAEPTGAPGATVSLVEKIGRIYQALRNRLTVTENTKQFYDDADAALWSKTLSDDEVTYDEKEGS